MLFQVVSLDYVTGKLFWIIVVKFLTIQVYRMDIYTLTKEGEGKKN